MAQTEALSKTNVPLQNKGRSNMRVVTWNFRRSSWWAIWKQSLWQSAVTWCTLSSCPATFRDQKLISSRNESRQILIEPESSRENNGILVTKFRGDATYMQVSFRNVTHHHRNNGAIEENGITSSVVELHCYLWSRHTCILHAPWYQRREHWDQRKMHKKSLKVTDASHAWSCPHIKEKWLDFNNTKKGSNGKSTCSNLPLNKSIWIDIKSDYKHYIKHRH